MMQVIAEKCADYALPALAVAGIWYGVHYGVLTERITKVELEQSFAAIEQDKKLPTNVRLCVKENLVQTTFDTSRMEAALYTASFRHIANPYTLKKIEAAKAVDIDCGVDQARAELAERKKRLAEQERLRQERARQLALLREQQALALEAERKSIAMREEATQRAREAAEKAAKKAREEAINNGISLFGELLGTLSGGQ